MTENQKNPSSAPTQETVEIKELCDFIVEAVQDKKGKGITLLDLSGIESAPALEFVVCEGRTPQQVSAIADNVREELLEKYHIKPYNYDGYRNSEWIVLDYGTVLVHVFVPVSRQLYNLEELWSDAQVTEIPDLD
ncbi:MAG: ribosome silencing factor [Muribaculaceae bacterium]|nr:ribosome silencing factor [Muribaculaceae bacterium]